MHIRRSIPLLVISLWAFSLCAQDHYFAKTISNYNEVLNSNKNEIYSLNKTEFDSLIKVDKSHEFHLVYSFGTWCKPCIAFLPQLLDWTEKNPPVKLYILNIEKDGDDRLLRVKDYLRQKHNFNENTFRVSDEYGKRRWKKYDAFVQEMAPSHDEYGMSLLLLYDKTGKLLYASTYNETDEEELLTMSNKIKE